MLNDVYIIAEAGVNHNGSVEIAKKLIEEAYKAGADAIKFQTYKTENLVSFDSPKAEYQTNNLKQKEETQYEMLKRYELDYDSFLSLNSYCDELGIDFLSTPFDISSLEFLIKKTNMKKIKISSGDINNIPLLLNAAKSGKEIILSTGISTLGEIETALSVIAYGYIEEKESIGSLEDVQEVYFSEPGQFVLKEKVSLLHCTSEYPAPFDEVNLNVLQTFKNCYGLNVGYSDHTEGIEIAIAAVALGAKIIEKHFTFDKEATGPDHKASIGSIELEEMVKSIRHVSQAMGSSRKIPTKAELKNKRIVRKSIVAAKKINNGERFTSDNITIKRPGTGRPPGDLWKIIGRKADRSYKKDDIIVI